MGPQRVSALGRLALARARAGAEAEAGPGTPEDVVASWRAARRVRELRPPLAVGDLALDGRDLIGMGMKPGPRFSEMLEGLLDWVLEDPARNTADVLRAEAGRRMDRWADG